MTGGKGDLAGMDAAIATERRWGLAGLPALATLLFVLVSLVLPTSARAHGGHAHHQAEAAHALEQVAPAAVVAVTVAVIDADTALARIDGSRQAGVPILTAQADPAHCCPAGMACAHGSAAGCTQGGGCCCPGTGTASLTLAGGWAQMPPPSAHSGPPPVARLADGIGHSPRLRPPTRTA